MNICNNSSYNNLNNSSNHSSFNNNNSIPKLKYNNSRSSRILIIYAYAFIIISFMYLMSLRR
jgi:hypothetical protein